MDHYKVLGINRNATKDEIKEAFRKLAVKYHPDKHSQSPQSVKDSATIRFKQVSEAYEFLSDDRKRILYNTSSNTNTGFGSGYGYGYGHASSSYDRSYSRTGGSRSKFSTNVFEIPLRYLTTRAFLLHLFFAGALLGGIATIDFSRDALWKVYNRGKSFEEAMESIEKSKAHKDL